MAMSLFCKIPVPIVDWEAGNMRYVMCAFPLVGVIEGALLALWLWLSSQLGLTHLAVAAGLVLIPLLLTGGIHLDGFCDVTDARSSHAEPERRRAILKDPHVGAFAVMGACGYLIAHLAASFELVVFVGSGWPGLATLMCLVPVISRCCSGIATLAFPKSADKGMLAAFAEGADVRHALVVLAVELVAVAAASVAIAPAYGLALLVASAVCLAWVHRIAMREFGGMSGDLAGWFLQVAELAMYVILAVLAHVA